MIEDLISLKEKGVDLLHEGNLDGALEVFDKAIGNFDVNSDDEALIKSVCLLNRSNIHLMQNEVGKAFEDASYVYVLFKERRFDLDLEKEIPENDKMVLVYSMAEQRKAEIFEEIDEVQSAIECYEFSARLSHSDPINLMNSIFSKLGFPKIDREDADLAMFSNIYGSLGSEKSILKTLDVILTFFQESDPNEEIINKIRENGCAMFIFGLIHHFIEKKTVVLACLCIAKNMAEFGIVEVYDGVIIVLNLFNHYSDDKDIIGMLLKYLRNAPDKICKGMEMSDFLVPIMRSLHLNLTPEESDSGFYVLFKMINSNDDYEEALNNKVIDEIFNKATISSVLLLSRLCLSNKCVISAHIKGSIPFSLAVMRKVKDPMLIKSCLIVVTKTVLMDLPETEKFMPNIIETIAPVLIMNSKDEEIVSKSLACLSLAIEKAPEAAKEQKLVKIASLLLVVYKDNKALLVDIINFFYYTSVSGMTQEIAESKSALEFVLKSVTENISCEEIATKGIATAIYCNHPSKQKLAEIGLKTYPESEIILKAIESMQKEK